MACHFHAFKPHLRLWKLSGRSCKKHRLLSNEANELPPGLGTMGLEAEELQCFKSLVEALGRAHMF